VIFTSLEYAGFLLVVVALNWALPKAVRPPLLLVASFVFYATWSVSATGILAAVCAVAWGAGLLIPRLHGQRRLALTTVAVASCTSSLVIFKLFEAFGFEDSGSTKSLVSQFAVPVGLSFFCFQAISYVVDIHRDELEPTRSPIDVALFVSFFPHLLAGPIVRAKKLIPAFHATPRLPDTVQWAEAAELVLVGTFKKVAIADPLLAVAIANFDDYSKIGPVNLVVSLTAVLVGGYFDVTGYIDIARGSAKFLGIDMQRNALTPLTRSTGYGDFWRRWQLTVMMWFRDYVFRPLRGSGREAWREHAALFGTFFVLGIWHGLTPGWALWGVASGVIIVGERTLQTRRAAARRAQTKAARKARNRSMLPKPPNPRIQLVIALALVMVTFPLVAVRSVQDLVDLYGALVRFGGTTPPADLLWLLAYAIAGVLLLDGRERRREAVAGHRDPVTLYRAVAFGMMLVGIIVFSGPAPQSFLYFNF
jgi:D-alanyl-lipoteichoic acid acyltransferase DltB (MBOAT superfamily)